MIQRYIGRVGLLLVLVFVMPLALTPPSGAAAPLPARNARPRPTATPTRTTPPAPTATLLPTPTPSAPPDFALSANYSPPSFTGFLVRGGLRLADCPLCTTDVEPRYVIDSLGCAYDSNTISSVSLNGFEGTITLEVLNLPAGVTSQTATSMFLTRGNAVSTPFKLQAASSAALGSATVTVRATSGAIVRTIDLPISVVDQPPPCQ
jgi:hypothetical protein